MIDLRIQPAHTLTITLNSTDDRDYTWACPDDCPTPLTCETVSRLRNNIPHLAGDLPVGEYVVVAHRYGMAVTLPDGSDIPASPARLVKGSRIMTTPNGCQHCGIEARSHGRQWTEAAGWHAWTAPTQQQIKNRMLAHRTTR